MGINLFGIFGKTKGKDAKAQEKKPDPKKRLGVVEGYYRKPGVIAIRIQKGTLRQDDKIRVKGYTTDFTCKASSLEIDHKEVTQAKKGQCVGIKVKSRARGGDEVYLATA